jgi:hypothetical protein
MFVVIPRIWRRLKTMKSHISMKRRQFTGIALLLTTVLFWQGCKPGLENVSTAKSPEELVYVRSDDDIINGGVIFTPPEGLTKPLAVIWIHGWGVNFYYPTYVGIGRALAERGYTCMTANTRMHDLGNVAGYRDGKRIRGGSYWGVASEEARDLAAWSVRGAA